jgi:hypothetical protein
MRACLLQKSGRHSSDRSDSNNCDSRHAMTLGFLLAQHFGSVLREVRHNKIRTGPSDR